MLKSRSSGLRGVVLSVSLGLLLRSMPLLADEAAELPPPPESGEASAGAELPPPPVPGAPEAPVSSADAGTPAPVDSTSVETPPGEELPSLPMEGDPKAPSANNEVPSDSGLSDLSDVPPSAAASAPTEFSSSNELKNVAMGDRIKSKDLVLWLFAGPSYGTLTGKGSYAAAVASVPGGNNAVGGVGYTAGIGGMLDDTFQLQFDFTGTPKTKSTTVDQAMFGFGPRFGFLTLMGVFGTQQGPDPTTGTQSSIFSIGVRAGLDLILKHSADSRVSIGIAPEAYYITPQGADGYDSMGLSVSLRIYGYDAPF